MTLKPRFDAVIFDLDGVITKTALVHAAAWKKMFDEYMRSREERFGEAFREFTHAGDYLPYVDGKPRYKGVESFLESRGIDIPFGDPSDEPGLETVCGLGNRKNIMFNKVLDEEGVEVYESTVAFMHELKEAGVRIGVASSSKNCLPVLEKAGLVDMVETRVDGVVSAEIGLKGKPEPDIFTTAADNLGVACHRAVVVEDAVSGVAAGKAGNFGLVLGLAREDNIRELYIGGADIVVEDFGDLGFAGVNEWFETGMDSDAWQLKYHDYLPESERSREALLAVGNGYFGTRGALEESSANEVNYPGTYVSGLFNRLTSKVGDREIENEDFVNIINWLPVDFRIDGGKWFGFSPDPSMQVRDIRRTLDMRNGTLTRELILEDEKGRLTRVLSSRFAGMDDPHRAGLRYSITPLNYSGGIEIRSALRGDHRNAGVKRYNDLNQQHLEAVSEEVSDERMDLVVRTVTSGIRIAASSKEKLLVPGGGAHVSVRSGPAWVSKSYRVTASEGGEVVLEKLVSLATSRDPVKGDPGDRCIQLLEQMEDYGTELARSTLAWSGIWDRLDVKIHGDRQAQKLVRLHLYHMMVSASPHHAGLDAGIGPRGLHGEAYRGHIFWDELYMLPLYNLHFPEVVRSVLMYRYRRLDAARKNAEAHGYRGAMFPWQSGSDGREETQIIHLNPLSGEWGDDYSSLQRHISIAIAFNTWSYYHASRDLAFMDAHGAELFLDICKFWVSKAGTADEKGKYHISRVMGPDEYHEKLPGSDEGGLTDNAYSNLMVSYLLEKAFVLMEEMSASHLERVLSLLGLDTEELEHWKDVMENLSLACDGNGIIEQFRGYFSLEELDWDMYRENYGDIHRLDRILKAEGLSPDDYKLSKQADLLMVFYLLGQEKVSTLLERLGHRPVKDYMERNYDYYIARTSHGSTLSRLVHARLAWQMGRRESGWDMFMEALSSDLVDIQGGTTGEGIHCGVMAGTVCDVLFTFGGLDLRGDEPRINPVLPGHWEGLDFAFSYRGKAYRVEISGKRVNLTPQSS